MSNTTDLSFPSSSPSTEPALVLGTLVQLKAFLLPETEREEMTYDVALTHIGKGVAGQLQRYCSRGFVRAAGIVEDHRGDVESFTLLRYPVEAITSLQIREEASESWDTLSYDYQLDAAAGLLEFYGTPGTRRSLVRVTYTGGYWIDETADGSGSLPSGATELPEDLKLAWLLQCQAVWALRDNVGAATLTKSDQVRVSVARMLTEAGKLTEAVETLLRPFRRMG